MVKIAESIAQLINMKRKRHYVNGIILNGTKFEFFQRAAKGAIKHNVLYHSTRMVPSGLMKKKKKQVQIFAVVH